MKVYIALEYVDYEGAEILGVYATKESAEAVCASKREGNTFGSVSYGVEEYEVQP